MRVAASLLLLVPLAGCLDFDALQATGSNSDGGARDLVADLAQPQGDDGPPAGTITITGTYGTHWVNDTSEVDAPFNLAGSKIEALLSDGNGGFVTYPGQGDTAGHFTIPNVVAGRYYVHVDSVWVVTVDSQLDFGYARVGRKSRREATVSPTTLTFNVTGLLPWSSSYGTELYGPHNGTAAYCLQCNAANPPYNGATSLSDLGYDLSTARTPYLFDANNGDGAILVESLTGTSSGGLRYLWAGAVATFPPFTVGNGGSANLTGTFKPLSQTLSISPVWAQTQFAALARQIHPQGQSQTHYLFVMAQPGDGVHGNISRGLNLIELAGSGQDTDVGRIGYSNPVLGWNQFGMTLVWVDLEFSVQGASALKVYGVVSTEEALPQFGSHAEKPLTGPPGSWTFDGKNAQTDQLVAANALVAWKAPAFGVAHGYTLEVYRLDSVNGATQDTFVAEIHTTGTSFTMPPGVLKSGRSYYTILTALHQPGVDLDSQPLKKGFPRGAGDALSGMLTVR